MMIDAGTEGPRAVFCWGVCALCVVGCASSGGNPETSPAPETPVAEEQADASFLDGVYGFEHTIRVFNPDDEDPRWEVVTVADTLVLTYEEDDSLTFQLDTAATNGHTCHLEGSMNPTPGSPDHWTFEDSEADPDDNGPCRAEVHLTPETINFDASSACKIPYCGMRASLGKRVFPRSSKGKFAPPEDL